MIYTLFTMLISSALCKLAHSNHRSLFFIHIANAETSENLNHVFCSVLIVSDFEKKSLIQR